MTTYIIDTSFIFSFADEDDSNYLKAREIMRNQESNSKNLVPFIVAAELSIGSNFFDFVSLARSFSSKFINNNDKDLDFLKTIPSATARSLKANDCLILALCKRYNAKLLTFDLKLERVYKELLREIL